MSDPVVLVVGAGVATGAPSFFGGDELFWGQDRLSFVQEALLAPPA